MAFILWTSIIMVGSINLGSLKSDIFLKCDVIFSSEFQLPRCMEHTIRPLIGMFECKMFGSYLFTLVMVLGDGHDNCNITKLWWVDVQLTFAVWKFRKIDLHPKNKYLFFPARYSYYVYKYLCPISSRKLLLWVQMTHTGKQIWCVRPLEWVHKF